MKTIKNFFYNLFVKLHFIKLKQFVIRQGGTLIGSFPGYNEAHALENMAKSFGHNTFEEFCRVLGVSPEAHKLEVIK